MSPLAFLARPSAGCARSTAIAARSPAAPNFSYELCLRRIAEHELEGLDLSGLALRVQRRRAGEPGDHDRRSARTLRAIWASTRRLDVAGLRPGRVLGRPRVHAAGRSVAGGPLDRDAFIEQRRRRARARRRSGSRSKVVALRPGDPRTTRCASSTPPARELPDRARRLAAVPRPVGDQRLLPQPRGDQGGCSTASGSTPATAPTSPTAMLYITGREKDIIIRGGRNISPYELEEAVGDLPGVRSGCVAVFGMPGPGERHRAHRGARRDARTARRRRPEDAEAAHQRPRDEPDRRAGRRHRARAAAHACRRPRAARSAASRRASYYERGPDAVRPQAVWLQFMRLAAAGVAPQLRARLARSARRHLRRARLRGPSSLTAHADFRRGDAPRTCRSRWKIGRRDDAPLPAPVGHPVAGTRASTSIPPGPVVLAPNHTSYLDALVLIAIARPATSSPSSPSASSCDNPLLRIAVLDGFGTRVRRALRRAEERRSMPTSSRGRARQGGSLIVFPEGTLPRRPGCCRSAPARSNCGRPASRWCRWRCAACARCCRGTPGSRAATR